VVRSSFLHHSGRLLCGGLLFCFFLSTSLYALEPPTAEQVRQYKADGTWEQRVAQAKKIGNNKTSPLLVARTRQKLQQAAMKAAGIPGTTDNGLVFAPPPAWQGGLPDHGSPKVLVLLVDFPDYPHGAGDTVADVSSKFFGPGDASQTPYESLHNFYQRSSYNALNIQGNVLGWYRAAHNRSYYGNLGMGYGQETLMMEALNYFDTTGGGHDFTQYDNDNNGAIDALYIKWTGPDNGWANFWWAFQWEWWANPGYTIDGKTIDHYVWSWIYNTAYDGATIYQAHVDIHETGHLLGLPDLYDYDGTVGPDGGVGGLDMMDSNWGDHNCFSKFMLEWLTPTYVTSGATTLALNPSGTSQDCVLIMPSTAYNPGTIFDEFFMAQYRKRGAGNDPATAVGAYPAYPTDGLIIWHVDSALNGSGTDFLYDNSYTNHKMLRLMEADGLEQIEQGYSANAGDFYKPTKTFGDNTTPNSHNYAGGLTNVQVDQLTTPGATMSGRFSVLSTPLIVAVGSTLATESCAPGNGAIDDQEMVTVNFILRNIGTGNTSNLVATLQPTGGATSPSGPQTYGALTAGGPAVSRPFVLVATGGCGGTLTATLQLSDGALDLGNATLTFSLGAIVPLSENFDSLTAPALPGGWTATLASGSTAAWATSASLSDSAPNAAFAPDPDTISDNRLDSPPLAITSSTAQLTFRHNYNVETNWDACALEIAIGAGAFTDILAAGGSFATGAYTPAFTVPSSYGNPLAGRQAWTGNSGGFITTTVNLPAAAAGRTIKLRWRLGSDTGVSAAGWYVDEISIADGQNCCASVPSIGDLDADGDVDQDDFGLFQACYSGPGAPQTDPACNLARMDADTDVDGDDYAVFVKCRSGPTVPADPNCRNH
jgi:M6 family metalloprotease-like protein